MAGSQIYLSCVEDGAVFQTDETNAEWIYVHCAPEDSEKDDALSKIQLSLYLFNGVTTFFQPEKSLYEPFQFRSGGYNRN